MRDLDFIVAMTRERVIGRDNQLPWRLPEDLKHFKRVTSGHTVIMGRKTFDSMGRALPNRKNIVLTRDRSFQAEGVTVCHSWEEVEKARGSEQCFVIGGGEIFQSALPRLRRLYLTVIDENIPGDAHFPELPLEKDFVLEDQSETFETPLRYRFQTWRHTQV
ncbi:dihydrofolate reductase [bacterium]|nr:dihydrofolate reductase [bacterium]